MKNVFFVFLLLSNICNAQNEMIVDYKITYNREKYIEREATLFIKDKISVFHEKMNSSKEIKKGEQAFEDDNTLKFNIKYNDQYYKYNSETKEMSFVDHIIMAGDFLVTGDIINIDWKLENESKMISNIKCNKATTFFRGRQWIVWYATSIPASFGPWKLNGLPGIILEAYETEKKFSYLATNIKYEKLNSLDVPTNNIKKMSFKEFVETKEDMPHLKNNLGRDETLKVTGSRSLELVYDWETKENK